MDNSCPLCDGKSTSKSVDHTNYFKFSCVRCGNHVISEIAAKRLQHEWLSSKDLVAEEAVDVSKAGNHLNIYQTVTESGPHLEVKILSSREFASVR